MKLAKLIKRIRNKAVLTLTFLPNSLRANTFSQVKQWQNAIYCWQADISRRGLNQGNLLGLVTNLMAMRRTEEIIDQIAKANFELNPALLFKLAEAQQRIGLHQESEATYRLALERMPEASEVQKQLVLAHSQMHLLPERIELASWVEQNYSEIKSVAAAMEDRSNAKPKVFVFWSQGFSQAPKIVQVCLRQLRSVVEQSDLTVLTKANLLDVIELPKVFDRLAKLYPAHYSDVLRVALLSKYRGIWVDATVWVGIDPLQNYLADGFFTFRYEGARMASWFMAAGEKAKTPQLLYAALSVYWRQHRKLGDYFLLHNIFEILYYLDADVRSEWDSAKHRSGVPCNQLGGKLLWQPYDQQALDQVLAKDPIQKLTYKPGARNAGPGTLFRHLTDSI